MRTLLLALIALTAFLPGCGSLFRAELGPTWIEDRGAGGTVQLTAGLPVVASYGLADVLVIGGSASLVQEELVAGFFFGCDATISPGGVDQPRGVDTRSGLGGALRFHPRIDTDGFAYAGGLALVYGEGERGHGGYVSLGSGEKSSLGISWDRRAFVSFGGAVDVGYRPAGDRQPGRLRVDALALIERLVVTE
ncbi:MAG: hypothetical protein R3F60_14510 [bacterium]